MYQNLNTERQSDVKSCRDFFFKHCLKKFGPYSVVPEKQEEQLYNHIFTLEKCVPSCHMKN